MYIFPEKVTCSYIRYVTLKLEAFQWLCLWAEKMCSFSYLLLGRRHNARRKGGLSMLCGKYDLACEHTFVWAAFMLFSTLPQRTLCVHYCLNFTKSQLFLQ